MKIGQSIDGIALENFLAMSRHCPSAADPEAAGQSPAETRSVRQFRIG